MSASYFQNNNRQIFFQVISTIHCKRNQGINLINNTLYSLPEAIYPVSPGVEGIGAPATCWEDNAL